MRAIKKKKKQGNPSPPSPSCAAIPLQLFLFLLFFLSTTARSRRWSLRHVRSPPRRDAVVFVIVETFAVRPFWFLDHQRLLIMGLRRLQSPPVLILTPAAVNQRPSTTIASQFQIRVGKTCGSSWVLLPSEFFLKVWVVLDLGNQSLVWSVCTRVIFGSDFVWLGCGGFGLNHVSGKVAWFTLRNFF